MLKSTKNIREEQTKDVNIIFIRFENDLAAFKKYVFNIKFQFRNFRRYLEQIQPYECIISENYNCKYHKEVQSYHFGGSQNQISRHTGVYKFDDQMPEA